MPTTLLLNQQKPDETILFLGYLGAHELQSNSISRESFGILVGRFVTHLCLLVELDPCQIRLLAESASATSISAIVFNRHIHPS